MQKNNQYLFKFKLFLLILAIIVINILTVNIPFLSGPIAYIQFVILLLILLLNSDINRFIQFLIIFSSTSFEVPQFVNPNLDGIYSIFNLPSVGVWGFLLILLIAIYRCYIKKSISVNLKLNKVLKLLLYFSIFTIVSGSFIGIFTYILNDNILPLEVFITFYKKDFSKYFISSLLILIFIKYFESNESYIKEIKVIIYNTLVSLIIGGFISTMIGIYGFYGEEPVILMPLSFFYSTVIVLFLFHCRTKKDFLITLCIVILSLYLQLSIPNALSGKSWAILFFLSVILFFYYIKSKFRIPLFIFLLSCVLYSTFSINSFTNSSNIENQFMEKKIDEAVSILDITKENYYENIDASPKGRIDEFLNLLMEYNEKPFYMLLGKGFGGGIEDHLNVFGSYEAAFFSDDEYRYKSFTFLHETVNVIFLKFGIIGMFFFILIIYNILNKGLKNPLVVLGLFWFFFFLGYTYSLGVFGIAALISGLFENQLLNEKSKLLHLKLNDK